MNKNKMIELLNKGNIVSDAKSELINKKRNLRKHMSIIDGKSKKEE